MELLPLNYKHNIKLVVDAAARVFKGNYVLICLCVCQAILESGLTSKPSQLASKYNNLFGIKGKGTGTSKATGKFISTVNLPTTEYVKGKKVFVDQFFAVNANLVDSVQQYKKIIDKDRYKRVRDSLTVEEAFENIYKCGYATDIKYPEKLHGVYTKYAGVINETLS